MSDKPEAIGYAIGLESRGYLAEATGKDTLNQHNGSTS